MIDIALYHGYRPSLSKPFHSAKLVHYQMPENVFVRVTLKLITSFEIEWERKSNSKKLQAAAGVHVGRRGEN